MKNIYKTLLKIACLMLAYGCNDGLHSQDIDQDTTKRETMEQSLVSNNLIHYERDNDTVIDANNSLMWQDNEDANSKLFDLEGAIKYCDNLSLNGYENWKLPRLDELETLIDNRTEEPSINSIFEHVSYLDDDAYWTVTKYKIDTYNWGVFFIYGSTFRVRPTEQLYTRCVRDI